MPHALFTQYSIIPARRDPIARKYPAATGRSVRPGGFGRYGRSR